MKVSTLTKSERKYFVNKTVVKVMIFDILLNTHFYFFVFLSLCSVLLSSPEQPAVPLSSPTPSPQPGRVPSRAEAILGKLPYFLEVSDDPIPFREQVQSAHGFSACCQQLTLAVNIITHIFCKQYIITYYVPSCTGM